MPNAVSPLPQEAAELLATIGRRFHGRGWVLGTSGNFSVVLDREPLRLAITASGASKGELTPAEIIEIDADCKVMGPAIARPSAEAHLHVEIVRTRGAGAVLVAGGELVVGVHVRPVRLEREARLPGRPGGRARRAPRGRI